MEKRRFSWIGVLGVFVLCLGIAGPAMAEKPIVIGYHVDFDRLVTLGPPVAIGMQDYIKVFNNLCC